MEKVPSADHFVLLNAGFRIDSLAFPRQGFLGEVQLRGESFTHRKVFESSLNEYTLSFILNSVS
jgi:hypothetical protein